MLPAAIVIAGLALPEAPPRQPPPVIIETGWSLRAGVARVALVGPPEPSVQVAALDDRPVGPGQLNPPRTISPAPTPEPKVEVLPATPAPAPAADAKTRNETPDEFAAQLKPDEDPFEGFNRISFKVSMALDKVAIRPAAMLYKTVVPKPLRAGMRNALSNLGEPFVLINDFLQLRPKRAVRTLGRFLLNSILGLGGLFDVAKDKKFRLPHHGNSFGDTLGFYGVKPGPYIYVPLLGPTTLRDAIGSAEGRIPGALAIDPLNMNNDVGLAAIIVGGLDQRVENDFDLKTLMAGAVDPYATFRTTWLQDRQGEITGLKAPDGTEPGSVPASAPLDDSLVDPAAPATQTKATAPANDPLADPLDDPAKAPPAKLAP